ncbi:DHH1, partial [Symbiodinium pilosum]
MTSLPWVFVCLLAACVSCAEQLQDSEHADSTEPDFMKYVQAPSPGPVVDKKYRPFIPDSYRDYIPRMDETGVEYQKYMQGSPDAKKFQEKVLPQGSYQQEIPLSQDASPAQSGTPQLLASSVSATAQHDENGASEGKHDAEPGFMKYMQAPSPGP